MKYNDNGEWKDIIVKATDTLPVGTEVDYNGTDVPDGWEEVEKEREISIGADLPTAETLGIILPINLFNKLTYTPGWLKGSDGSFFNQYTDTYGVTHFIPVEPNTTYSYYIGEGTGISSGGCACYTSSQVFLGGYDYQTNTQQIWTITTPWNCRFIRFTFYLKFLDNISCNQGGKLLPYKPYIDTGYIIGYNGNEYQNVLTDLTYLQNNLIYAYDNTERCIGYIMYGASTKRKLFRRGVTAIASPAAANIDTTIYSLPAGEECVNIFGALEHNGTGYSQNIPLNFSWSTTAFVDTYTNSVDGRIDVRMKVGSEYVNHPVFFIMEYTKTGE